MIASQVSCPILHSSPLLTPRQIMPFGDLNVMGQWGACEAAVYQAVGGGDMSKLSIS